MRLLDLVAQSSAPSPGLPREWQLPSPCHFAHDVLACPLRLVLADDLTTCTTLLAYAEGERLSGCLDLLHVPAQQLWVEWVEAPRVAALNQVAELNATPHDGGRRRSGVLISTDRSGRAGSLRTFWSGRDDQAYCAALITEFDLDDAIRPVLDVPGVFRGEGIGVCLTEEPAIDALLAHVSFRLDAAWAAYYRAAPLTTDQQHQILHAALGTTAFDIPMLFALFLLFTARNGVVLQAAPLARLNAARRRGGRKALVEHVEARTSLLAPARVGGPSPDVYRYRRGPRLHHVRGHITRRGNKVFWRSPHLRGNARVGVMRSRTVQLVMR